MRGRPHVVRSLIVVRVKFDARSQRKQACMECMKELCTVKDLFLTKLKAKGKVAVCQQKQRHSLTNSQRHHHETVSENTPRKSHDTETVNGPFSTLHKLIGAAWGQPGTAQSAPPSREHSVGAERKRPERSTFWPDWEFERIAISVPTSSAVVGSCTQPYVTM